MARRTPQKLDIAIGRAIRLRRSMAQVSQSELGQRVGVSFQQIQKYENGKNRVTASKLVEIAEALDSDVRDYFAGVTSDETARLENPDHGFVLTHDSLILNHAFTAIDDAELRKKIIDLVKCIGDPANRGMPVATE